MHLCRVIACPREPAASTKRPPQDFQRCGEGGGAEARQQQPHRGRHHAHVDRPPARSLVNMTRPVEEDRSWLQTSCKSDSQHTVKILSTIFSSILESESSFNSKLNFKMVKDIHYGFFLSRTTDIQQVTTMVPKNT